MSGLDQDVAAVRKALDAFPHRGQSLIQAVRSLDCLAARLQEAERLALKDNAAYQERVEIGREYLRRAETAEAREAVLREALQTIANSQYWTTAEAFARAALGEVT